MTVHVYKSTDTGAPSLSGTAGSLVALLDALLVDGYNSNTVTITSAAGVATVTDTAHGFNAGQTIVISGANETDYNLTTRVTVIDANSYSYPVANNPATPATGTITAKVAPLGWTKAFSGTNKAAYRTKAGTNQFYLRVDDAGTGSAAYARVVGYETMSDVDTGTGPFPTAAQRSGGSYAWKSSAASGTARTWKAFSNGKIIHLFVKGDGNYWIRPLTFGDFRSFKAGDAFGTMFRSSDTGSGWGSTDGGILGTLWTSSATGLADTYIARSHTQTGTSLYSAEVSAMRSGSQMSGTTLVATYPAPIAGGMILAPVMLREGTANAGPRGLVPGLYDSAHNIKDEATLTDGDTWSGASGSDIEGKTFEVLKASYNGSAFIVETSDTWDA